MGRRRKRKPYTAEFVVELLGSLLALALLLVFWATGFNLKATMAVMNGLLYLLVVGVVVVVAGVIAFLVIRHLMRVKHSGNYAKTLSYGPPKVLNASSPPETPPVTGKSWRFDGVLIEETPNSDMTERSPALAESVVEKLRATDWYQFEKVVGLIYESRGYLLERRGGQRPDGGIDLIIEKDGERAAVQCKRWKKWEVKEPLIRELLGAMTHERLTKGVVVGLNGFTHQAKQLAIEHNIDVVHDENLADMIAELSDEDRGSIMTMLEDETKHCPICEARMVWREPKPGKRQFKSFWGCSRFSQGCYGKLQDG